MEFDYSTFFLTTKKCLFKKRSKTFASFCTIFNDNFLDVFNKTALPKDSVSQIFYTECNKKYLIYLKKLYSLNPKLGYFLVDDIVESELLGHPLSPILRFFTISKRDLFNKTISPFLIKTVATKCYRFIKRYHKDYAETYYYQILKFKSLIDVFMFCPLEFRYNPPFWHTILKESQNITFDFNINKITINELAFLNSLDINVMNLKKEYENMLLDNHKAKNKAVKDLQSTVQSVLRQHIKKANSIIKKERLIANNTDDGDLKLELNIIQQELNIIQTNLNSLVSTFDESVFLKKWWPPLLYPIPYSKIHSLIHKYEDKLNKNYEAIKEKTSKVLQILKSLYD